MSIPNAAEAKRRALAMEKEQASTRAHAIENDAATKASGEISTILKEIDDQLEGAFRNVATLSERIAPVLSKNVFGSLAPDRPENTLSDLGEQLYGYLDRLRHVNGQLEGLHNSVAL